MKEQAWGDIFIHFKKKKESEREKGGCVYAKGQEGAGQILGGEGRSCGTYMLEAGRGLGWRGMSAPQVLPVADDSLLSSSGTS